ncbi:hypothetical protein Tco_0612598 [Tanacetum coccineum]
MGDENHMYLRRLLQTKLRGYWNTIELPVGNNVAPLRSDTIRLVQNGCSFHGLRSEDPNQHLKDFLKLVDSLDLDGENRNEEDKRKGVDYVMSKILGFYKECLELGPEYVTGLDDEGEVT